MKRSAERQLTKDDGGDDDIEEIQSPEAFQKADESTLAKRQIRALPKRALAGSRPPSLNGLPPTSASDIEKAEVKFGGFSGFGAATSASSPFTFAAQPPVVSAPSPSTVDATFKPAQPTSTSASPFLGGPNPADVSLPKPALSVEETDAFKYFKSLRGLNVSFLSVISAAVEKDPFYDVANLVESYKNLRTTIQSEFDSSPQPSTSRGLITTNLAPIFGASAQPEKTSPFLMPKPSAEISSNLPLINEGPTKASGFFQPFVPPPTSVPTQSPFGLNPKQSESSTSSSATTPEPPKSAFAFAASRISSHAPTSGFLFASSSSAENATSKSGLGSSSQETEGSSASPSSRPNSTAPSFGSSSALNLFATTKPTSVFGNSDAASKAVSAFGGSVFGSSNTTGSSKSTPFNPPPPDGKDSSKLNTTLFGSVTAASSSTSVNVFRPSPEKPVSAFGSAFQTGAFGGKSGGSIGNPVGFGFGSSVLGAGEAAAPGTSSSGFTFGVPSTKSGESLFSPPMTDKSSESTPQPEVEANEEGGEEDAAKLLPSHTHDEEGEGEEDEEATHVVRCKVYRLFKTDAKSEWKDLGIGMFRLKRHKETDARRVLMRNSNTGRILINFRIHASLKPTLTKNAVSFVGYENSTPTSFSIKVKTEEQAKELKQAMDREIAAVQSAE